MQAQVRILTGTSERRVTAIILEYDGRAPLRIIAAYSVTARFTLPAASLITASL